MPELAPDAQKGFDIAQRNGCTSCHGPQGQGGVAPAFLGLAGSQVPLDDGTTVVADTDYLKRSISDPKAQKVAGYTIEMPNLSLPDAEIDQIVTYLEAVGTK